MAIIQDVTPGVPVDTSVDRALRYALENRGDGALPVTVQGQPPASAGLETWELGYEPLPDAAWLLMSPTNVVLPPAATVYAHATLRIPAGSQWANRRFVACVAMRPGNQLDTGAGLALAARVLIDTAANASADAGADAPIATVPSRVEAQLAADGSATVTVLVRRPKGDGPLDLAWRRLNTVETDFDRRLRYRTPGTIEEAIIAHPTVEHLTAEAGAWFPLSITLSAPADAVPSTRYEEILVIGTNAELDVAADPRHSRQPAVALIRCQIRIPQTPALPDAPAAVASPPASALSVPSAPAIPPTIAPATTP